MIVATRIIVLSGVVLAGCSTARDVAVSSFRVLDAPANYVRRKIDPPDTNFATATTERSDVVSPGRPMNVPPSPAEAPPQRVAAINRPALQTSPRPARTSSPAPAPKQTPVTAPAVQFPSAKPIPGRPGYVYSLDPKGGIIDVTGYKPGDKAKDPYTQQIFIVP